MSESQKGGALTRRKFLKMTTAGAALTAAAIGAGTRPLFRAASAAQSSAPAPASGEQVTFGMCRMCQTYFCGTRVHTQNGVVTYVEGAPECEVNQGTLCIRGHGTIMNHYDPYRVKKPLVRTNPQKGLDIDPKWREVTWDEALQTLGTKMKEIRSRDPRRIAVVTGFGARGSLYSNFLGAALGTPNSTSTSGAICSTHFENFLGHGTMMDRTDVEYCKLFLAVGRGSGANFGEAQGTMPPFVAARERGMKFIVVDPRMSPEASGADEWVPIRPGTDLSFFLAMMNVILFERKQFDTDFVKNRSNAPYLIGADGLYVRDAASKKPMIWDASDSKAKLFDDPTLKDPALEGTFTVNGVAATPAFQLLLNEVKERTPEWGEKMTTVPAATIRRIANEFVDTAQIGATIQLGGETFPFRPVAIDVNRGVTNRKSGHLAAWAAVVLCELMGAMDVPGARLGSGFGPFNAPDADGTLALYKGTGLQPGPFPWKYPPSSYDVSDLYPHRHNVGYNMIKSLENPKKYGLDYPLELAIYYGGAHFGKGGMPDRIASAMLKIPYSVALELLVSENAILSDMILPEHSVIERSAVNINEPGAPEMRPKIVDHTNIGLTGIVVNVPPVKPLYDTLDADEIILRIADAAGVMTGQGGILFQINRQLKAPNQIDVTQKYTYVDLLDRRLKTVTGKGLDVWAKEGFETKRAEIQLSYNYHYNPKGKTRYNLYRHVLKQTTYDIRANLKKAGVDMPGWDLEDFLSYYQPLPVYRPNNSMSAPAGFDMYAVVWRTPAFMFDVSGVQNNALLHDVAGTWDPYQFVALMNRATAQQKGFTDGQTVWVESPYGKTKAELRLTETVHPETVGFPGGFQRWSAGLSPLARKGTSFNALVPIEDGTFEPVTGGLDTCVKVKVYAA